MEDIHTITINRIFIEYVFIMLETIYNELKSSFQNESPTCSNKFLLLLSKSLPIIVRSNYWWQIIIRIQNNTVKNLRFSPHVKYGYQFQNRILLFNKRNSVISAKKMINLFINFSWNCTKINKNPNSMKYFKYSQKKESILISKLQEKDKIYSITSHSW